MVFLSHANPEDNEIARWLSLQLASNGYPVWCDLTKLLGGERFWEDIQDAIRNHTAKFVFLLSRASNQKRGTLDELDCALGTEKRAKLQRFVLTLKVDELAHDDVYIGIRRLNHLQCGAEWAKGLHNLLARLAEDQVPQNANFSPESVCAWWREEFGADHGILRQPEEVLSNWFKVEDLPETLHVHTILPAAPGPVDLDKDTLPYPVSWLTDDSFLSFAKADDFHNSLGNNLVVGPTSNHALAGVISGTAIIEGPKHLAELLRTAWERALGTRMRAYQMASGKQSFYFTQSAIPDDTIHFVGVDGQKTWRNIIGFKTLIGDRKRIWHYSISGKPIIRPETLFVIKGHVLFSDDGQTLWDNKDATAKARRNQCKNWWNDEWRDRLLAVMSHLAGEDGVFHVPLGSDVSFSLSRLPILFESPVSYPPPGDLTRDDHRDYDFEPEDEEEEEQRATEGQETE